MAVTTIYAPVKQAGNGVNLAFSGSFKILAQTDLVVQKIDASGNLSAALVLGVDYTVVFDAIAETWTVTYAVAPVLNGYSVVTRVSNQTQGTVYPREGTLPAKATETAIDKAMLLIQELLFGSNESPIELSGLYTNKPVNSALPVYYYSTDRQSYEKWVPAAQRWFLLG